MTIFWLYSGYILATFWLHYGYILATFWLHFGYILATLLLHFGYILASFWLHSGYILATFWLHLAIFWLHFGYIWAIFWLHFGCIDNCWRSVPLPCGQYMAIFYTQFTRRCSRANSTKCTFPKCQNWITCELNMLLMTPADTPSPSCSDPAHFEDHTLYKSEHLL